MPVNQEGSENYYTNNEELLTTSQALQSIIENPKNKYELENESIILEIDENGDITLENIDLLKRNYRWRKYIKPIKFSEAIIMNEAIQVKHKLTQCFKIYSTYSKIKEIMKILSENFTNEEIHKIINEAKCYVKEED